MCVASFQFVNYYTICVNCCCSHSGQIKYFGIESYLFATIPLRLEAITFRTNGIFLQWFHVLGRFKANEFQSHEQHTDKHTCSLRRHKIDAPVWFTLGKNINKIIESKMNSNHFHENCYSILRASRVFNWFPHMRSSSVRSMACSATRSVDGDNGGVWEKNPTAINRKNDSDAERVRTVKSNLFVATALHFESIRRRWNVPSITQSAGKS